MYLQVEVGSARTRSLLRVLGLLSEIRALGYNEYVPLTYVNERRQAEENSPRESR